MEFNPRKPYGTVTGHPWARYEQAGELYDANGQQPFLRDEDEIQENQENDQITNDALGTESLERDFALEHAREFLKTILADGPLTRSAVYREAQNNNQAWEKVEQAFAKMQGEKFKKANWTYWKLKTE